jgi:hypothetical protein
MDIDPDKAQAALEQLEAEKAKRLQAKIEAGEVLVISDAVIIRDESELARPLSRPRRVRGHSMATAIFTLISRW